MFLYQQPVRIWGSGLLIEEHFIAMIIYSYAKWFI